jgi:putative acetyltransferase
LAALYRLRPYATADEDASIALWLETWRQAYPSIDFDARVDWWRERWRTELVPLAQIVVAEQDDALIGFVTIDGTGYLDQLVVSPAQWGSSISRALVDEAKRLSPGGVTLKVNADNVRAIRFYERNGFAKTGEEVNSSGRAVWMMAWTP